MHVVREVFKVSPVEVEASAFSGAIEKMKTEIHKLDFETVMRGYVVRSWKPFKLSEAFHPREGNPFSLLHKDIVFTGEGALKKNAVGIDFLLLSCFTASPELFSWIVDNAETDRKEALMHDRDTSGKNLLHYLFMSRQKSDDIKGDVRCNIQG